MKTLLTALCLLAFSATAFQAEAAAEKCRNEKGQFVSCSAAPAKAARCRDANGRFTKCSAKETN